MKNKETRIVLLLATAIHLLLLLGYNCFNSFLDLVFVNGPPNTDNMASEQAVLWVLLHQNPQLAFCLRAQTMRRWLTFRNILILVTNIIFLIALILRSQFENENIVNEQNAKKINL